MFISSKKRERFSDRIAATLERAKRCLFVEDEQIFIDFTRKTTEEEFLVEFEVASAYGDARRILEASSKFDFAILDVRLVNGTGVELYRTMHQIWPAIEVVFLTAYDDPKLRAEVEAIGPARVYSKQSVTRDFMRCLFCQLGCRRRQTATSCPFPR